MPRRSPHCNTPPSPQARPSLPLAFSAAHRGRASLYWHCQPFIAEYSAISVGISPYECVVTTYRKAIEVLLIVMSQRNLFIMMPLFDHCQLHVIYISLDDLPHAVAAVDSCHEFIDVACRRQFISKPPMSCDASMLFREVLF